MCVSTHSADTATVQSGTAGRSAETAVSAGEVRGRKISHLHAEFRAGECIDN